MEHTGKSLYFTVAGYYQYGHNFEGKAIKAFYVQPEIKYKLPKHLSFRLGAEVFSGDDAMSPRYLAFLRRALRRGAPLPRLDGPFHPLPERLRQCGHH